jgi:hypothetical protein
MICSLNAGALPVWNGFSELAQWVVGIANFTQTANNFDWTASQLAYPEPPV